MLDLLQQVYFLKQLPRTGWLFAGVVQPESVAEHSFATTWLALLLTETINGDLPAQGLTAPLARAQVMEIALVHDLAESILTDLPKRSTQLLGAHLKHGAEANAMQQLFHAIPNGDHYIQSWQAYADGATPEARLVRDADKLEMVHQALRYEQGGQRNLADFWQHHQWNYPISKQVFEQLQRLRSA
ncbi:MAG: HD family hydrolase [Caldilineaceae bacterium]